MTEHIAPIRNETHNPKRSSSIDAFVGMRVRAGRMARGMSQEQLAELLGLTFQQVQKYEKGVNRIGAGRLWDISRILDVSVQYFFDGLNQKSGAVAEESGRFAIEFLTTTEGLQLARAFAQIKDRSVRRRLVDLAQALSDAEPEAVANNRN